jgi:hypothetical protein
MSSSGRNLWLLIAGVFCLLAFVGVAAFALSVVL